MALWGLCPRHLQHLGWGLSASPPRAPAPLPSASTEDSRDRRIGLSTLQARARGSVNTSFGSCFQLFGSNASSRARSSSGLSPVMYMGLTKPRARGQHRPSPVPRQELCQGWVPVPALRYQCQNGYECWRHGPEQPCAPVAASSPQPLNLGRSTPALWSSAQQTHRSPTRCHLPVGLAAINPARRRQCHAPSFSMRSARKASAPNISF